MFQALHKVFRPNAFMRRVAGGLFAAFVLLTIVFSSIFVAFDANHECSGQDCHVCQEMQVCVANFQLMGSSAATGEAVLPLTPPSVVETVPCARRAHATTLQSLNVRFDE